MPIRDRIRRLRDERQRRLDELLRSLESEAAPAAEPPKQLREKLDLIDYALGELKSGWAARVMPVVIAATVIGVLLSVLSLWPIRSVAFTLELKATAISMVTAAEGVVEDLVLKPPLRVVGFDHMAADVVEEAGGVAVGVGD